MRPTALERAFELARSGNYANVPDIRERLRAEGLSSNQVNGPTLIRQLRLICTQSFTPPVAEVG